MIVDQPYKTVYFLGTIPLESCTLDDQQSEWAAKTADALEAGDDERAMHAGNVLNQIGGAMRRCQCDYHRFTRWIGEPGFPTSGPKRFVDEMARAKAEGCWTDGQD